MSGAATMAAATLTLADCLPQGCAADLANAPPLREAVARAAPAIPPAALEASLPSWRSAVEMLLRVQVGRMFEAAALKLAGSAPEVAGEPGGGETLVSLLPFAVESSHHPTVGITCAGTTVVLRFDVELSLEVTGAQLRVAGGRFVGARTGTAKGVVRLLFLNGEPPVEVGSPEFTMPSVIDFAPPAPGG